MRIPSKPSPHNRKGYALILVLCFLVVTLAVVADLLSWTSFSAKTTGRNNQFLASESAAESADEYVIASMTRDYLNQSLNSVSSYTSLIPTNTSAWPVTYNFTDASGNANKTTVTEGTEGSTLQPLTSQFSNLKGYIQPVTITSTATPTKQLYNEPATVTENIEFDTIPIFQFAIFYNLNMEIDPGQNMTVKGPVYCNASIWAGASDLTFLSSVDAVGTINTTTSDPFADNYSGTGSPTFDVAPLTNQPSLTMPISGTNNSASSVQNILNLPLGVLGAPNPAYLQASNQSYIFNEANLIISNSSAGVNGNSSYRNDITIYYENSNVVGYLQLITNDVVQVISNYVTVSHQNFPSYTTNLYYSFVTNVTFTDYRESDTVQAVQIDVGKFNAWLNSTTNYVYMIYNNKILSQTNPPGGGASWNLKNTTGGTSLGHGIDSIYVYNNAPFNTSQLPAVQLVHGAQLPSTTVGTIVTSGLTVATEQPLYVQGDYNVQTLTSAAKASAGTTNTANTYPAALMGDAITVLSDNWNNSNGENQGAGATTINAACLEGIVQTNPKISGNYSGGTENFLRLLENWTGVNLTYNGSIIVMFYSQYATGYWSYGTYYDAPNRNWSFDENFQQANKLPPLTPSVKVMLRTPGGWSVN
ncbi:MAG TPA: hypothetical protein VGH42_01375 [Verrucomicrobiae bacterium]|jgi:hypothetical protein